MKLKKIKSVFHVGIITVFTLAIFSGCVSMHEEEGRIQPYALNPFYWQYKGKPLLLIGGSDNDNLFNHITGLKPGNSLAAHLDTLVSVGGNCVRNTMSHRDEGNVFPYIQDVNGIFDLNQPNPEYWNRFENLLKMTEERDIIVQIEVWATYDYGKITDGTEDNGGWINHPFNPKNNKNYTQDNTTLLDVYDEYYLKNPFFITIPERNNDTVVLHFQQAFVDRILSHAFKYSHVLYCMDNETWLGPEWPGYWCGYIQDKALKAGIQVETSEMYSRPKDAILDIMVSKPELYTFIDVSQNNSPSMWSTIQEGWDNLMVIREKLADSPRPMNNTKIYGGANNAYGGIDIGIQRFWRNLIAGCAMQRFHRPNGGIGLNKTAQANIRSARMLDESMNIFSPELRPRNDLLSDREENEAYMLAEAGTQYALYFTNEGSSVMLDLSGGQTKYKLKWLNISQSRWEHEQTLQGGGNVQISKPDSGHWLALILINND